MKFDAAGDPAGVERLGIALEPEADYELRPRRRRLRGSAHHVCRAASALCDGLRGALAHRTADRPGHLGGFVSLEATGASDL